MNPRRIKIFVIKTDKENHVINVSLSYSKGGLSFWDYKHYPEGIYLHMQPVKRSISSGMTIEQYEGGTGVKHFVEAGARFSSKRLKILALSARENKGTNLENFSAMLKKICEEHGYNFEKLDFGV